MNAPRLVSEVLPWVWIAWSGFVSALTLRAWRRDVLPSPSRRRSAWVLLILSAGLVVASFLAPFRIDASGLMELHAGTEPWKGAVGEAALRLVRWFHHVEPTGIIVLTRLFLLPSAAVAIALASDRPTAEPWTARGFDLRLLVLVGALLITPSFSFGVMGVFNFWFFPVVVLGVLLALHELETSPSWLGRLTLWTSLPLLAFARPETIVATLVMALLVSGASRARKDHRTWVPTLVLACGMVLIAPSMLSYLDDRVRNQPLLMGADTAGDAPFWTTGWILVRRVVEHLPINLLVLVVALHVLGGVAVFRVLRILRTRSASLAEVAALGLLVTEFVAIGVHREGFLRYDKYGQLVVVPFWLLFVVGIPMLGAVRQRKVLGAAAGAGALLFVAHVTLSGLGVGRCAAGGARDGMLQDETLLWEVSPRWVRSACVRETPALVVVVQLDERGAMPEQQRPAKPEGKTCEPERWPLAHQWSRAGCASAVVVPGDTERLEKVLCDPNEGVLRSPLRFDALQDPMRHPNLGVVSFYRPERLAEVTDVLRRRPDCGWEVKETARSAVLLRRTGGR